MVLYSRTTKVGPDVWELIETVIGVGFLTYGVETGRATCAAIL